MKNLFLLLTVFLSTSVIAQRSVRDSSVASTMIQFNLGMHAPQSDLASKFYGSGFLGVGIQHKTGSNWTFGIEGGLLFRDKIKPNNLLQNITTDADEIFDQDNSIAEVKLMQRGLSVTLTGGKILPIFNSNQNSGLYIKGGIGYLHHKIRIENQEHVIPQLSDEYKKGYDQLRSGLSFQEFVGYFHMSDNRLVNFYLGLESIQGLTKSRRTYDFNLKGKDTSQTTDVLIGCKVGWIIHLYRRTPREFYID